jgi:hypothetical protein
MPLAATLMAATLGMGGAGALVTPSMAGPEQHAMLLGFIGDWRGEGALVGGDRNEPFRCRLSITQGNSPRSLCGAVQPCEHEFVGERHDRLFRSEPAL